MATQGQEWRGAHPYPAACSLPGSSGQDNKGELEGGVSPRAFWGGTRVKQRFETGSTCTELETGALGQQNHKTPAQPSPNQP